MIANQSTLFNASLITDVKRLEFKTRRILDSDLIGQYRSAFRGSGLIYSDLREYQPGDEVKSIHWKASARTGKVYVKSYEEDRMLNVMLLVDISRSTDYGFPKTRHIRAFEFAALIALLAQKNGDAIGLSMFSDAVEEFTPPRRSRTQIQKVILSLMEHRSLKPASNMPQAIEHLQKHLKRRGIVFIVSDFVCPPFEEQLKKLAYKHDVIAVYLEDSPETCLPKAGIVEYCDAESGETCLLDTQSEKSRQQYKEIQSINKKRILDVCTRSRTDLITISDNPLRPLVELMKKRSSHMWFA